MCRLHPLLFIVILAGCTASAKYDIDVSCPLENYGSIGSTEGTMRHYCSKWENDFDIRCVKKTVQKINDEYLCTTPDGKSVRIQVKD